jgi:hypothetical protein
MNVQFNHNLLYNGISDVQITLPGNIIEICNVIKSSIIVL